MNSLEQRIKAKLESAGTPLKEWDIHVDYGIKTGLNDAFIITSDKREEILANCIDEKERQKTDALIRPILRGKDIKRYGYNWENLWIINTHNGIADKLNRIDISEFPAIKMHLDEFSPNLEKRADQGDTPYNLRNCAYLDDFFQPKIIFQEIVQESQFMFDEKTHFMCNDTCRIITGNHLKFLLGVLNSKLFFFSIKKYYSGGMLGSSGVRMKHTFFSKFPCIQYNQEIENLVNQIINSADKQDLDKRIDQIIYNEYNLTKEEISYIESQ